MKKNWFYLFLFMALAVMPLTSCDKDDDSSTGDKEQFDSEDDNDREKITAFDALSWLQGALVVVDENDEVFSRIYGKPLDESQPTVISVPVADYAAAENLFLDWVAPGKETTKIEGGYDYNLTDAEGKAQGSVLFRAVEGEDGVIARMSVAEGTALKQVSEVNFIDADFWPENDATAKYIAGKTYTIYGYDLSFKLAGGKYILKTLKLEPLTFYCIQGNTDGKEGILVWICPDVNDASKHPFPEDYIDNRAYQHFATTEQADKVLKFYNSNKSFWDNMMAEMGWKKQSGYATTGDDEFLLNAYNPEKNKITCLDLDEEVGYMDNVSYHSWNKYRYIYVRTVPPATN